MWVKELMNYFLSPRFPGNHAEDLGQLELGSVSFKS